MPAFTATVAAYTSSPPARPLQSFPSLSVAWDGAATPTLTVKTVSDGKTCAVYSGQAMVQAGIPQPLLSAAKGASPWLVGPA